MFTFAPATLMQGDDTAEFVLSGDEHAFTVLPSQIETSLGAGKMPVATRTFSLVVPLKGYGKQAEVAFRVGGFATTEDGAAATMVSSVNGRTTVNDFAGATEESFTQEVRTSVQGPSEFRLTIVLIASRGMKDAGLDALVKATTIDAEVVSQS